MDNFNLRFNEEDSDNFCRLMGLARESGIESGYDCLTAIYRLTADRPAYSTIHRMLEVFFEEVAAGGVGG